ncbi:hypothetical protein PoB_001110400 [Plakobranchus ocellatus]|uniref:Secreted protein n=1 Tax=Plakobranchus ocellatus TaxID=259542 RepID=A0AAV3YNI3_9GAST|nr:hypothetical protein PoB_001110400 [Plakobranchus ocellatus]
MLGLLISVSVTCTLIRLPCSQFPPVDQRFCTLFGILRNNLHFARPIPFKHRSIHPSTHPPGPAFGPSQTAEVGSGLCFYRFYRLKI